MGNFSTKNVKFTFKTFTLPFNIFAVYVTYNIFETVTIMQLYNFSYSMKIHHLGIPNDDSTVIRNTA